jgi:hypothetical protein
LGSKPAKSGDGDEVNDEETKEDEAAALDDAAKEADD